MVSAGKHDGAGVRTAARRLATASAGVHENVMASTNDPGAQAIITWKRDHARSKPELVRPSAGTHDAVTPDTYKRTVAGVLLPVGAYVLSKARSRYKNLMLHTRKFVQAARTHSTDAILVSTCNRAGVYVP